MQLLSLTKFARMTLPKNTAMKLWDYKFGVPVLKATFAVTIASSDSKCFRHKCEKMAGLTFRDMSSVCRGCLCLRCHVVIGEA
jgi:hypothetical protein